MNSRPYPNPIHFSLGGVHDAHEPGYTVDRRTGGHEYLFELFESPVTLQDDRERRAYAGNVFILYAPGQRQYFRAEGPLTHTWFQVTGDDVATCLERYQIPVNRAVETADLHFLAPQLESALRHRLRKHRYWEDAVTETFRAIFRRLARTLFQQNLVEQSPYRKHLLATMYGVRAQVYKDLTRRWTVDDMAALASMSVQRFAVAYRSYFGTGPIDDLIDVRLRHADLLLRHLPVTVVDAAHYSGFNTGSNFHVLFRERMGRSPRGLAKSSERGPAASVFSEELFDSTEAARRVKRLYVQPVGHWSFDGDGESVTDDLGKHPPAILHNGVQRVPGRLDGQALQFDGTNHAMIPETILDTSRSYTVCAWLAHGRPGRMTAVSIGNSHHGAFYLQYISYDGGFKFAVTVSERDPLALFVVGTTPTVDGEWYHVTGVHDAKRQEIRLYVNGRLEGHTSYETPWRADGSTDLGCCQLMDTIIDHWFGAMDDLRLYDTTLSDAEIARLYRDEAIPITSNEGSHDGQV